MIRFLLTIIIYNLTVLAYGQILTVRDAESNIPLEMVSIFNPKTKTLLYTDVDGKVEIREFEGSEKIDIRIFGYKSVIKSFAELTDSDYIVLLTQAPSITTNGGICNQMEPIEAEIPAWITTITTAENF